MDNKLARVHWQMGQTLLPEHFYVQEQSLLTDMAARLESLWLPLYGLGALRWNESLLAEGVLNILSMSVVMPSGELIRIPDNANAPPFNMNATGQARVSVYFHLMGQKARAEVAMMEGGNGSDDSVERMVYDIAINSDESTSGALQTLGLADFSKDAEGNWQLSADYIPPLLKVGTSPFLMDVIADISEQVDNFHFKLVQTISATYLSGESLFGSKKVLQAVYKLQGFLQNLRTQIHFHPYFVFEALKEFYIELCFYQNTTPDHVKRAYIHHDVASCIYDIARPLMHMLKQVRAEAPYMPFELKDGMFKLENLPERVSSSRQVFLLIQKERVGDRFSLEQLKLASLSRISIVHQLSLGGVPFEKIDRPPFQHSFGPEVEFYQIRGGEEWDYVLRDMSLAFYDQPDFKNLRAYIYWREG